MPVVDTGSCASRIKGVYLEKPGTLALIQGLHRANRARMHLYFSITHRPPRHTSVSFAGGSSTVGIDPLPAKVPKSKRGMTNDSRRSPSLEPTSLA